MKHPISILLAALTLSAAACQNSAPAEPAAPAEEAHHAPPAAAEVLEPYECGTVTKLHTFQGIFLASQPSASDFEQASKGGIRTVLNIRHDAEITDMDEQAVVEGLGLNYIHLPWNGPEEMTDEMMDKMRDVLKGAERPILFHCASSNRVGAVWLAYRVLDDGLSIEEATVEAKTVGMRSPAYEQKALDYVRRNG